jgi:hypothetical protein
MTGPRTDLVEFPPGAVGDYRNPQQAELFGKTSAAWAFSILPVRSIDISRNEMITDPGNYTLGKVQGYASGEKTGDNMWVENVLEELTEPGEWVFDSERRRLYLWPEGGEPGRGIAAPALAELILLEGEIDHEGPTDLPVTGIHFKGIEFSECDRESGPADRRGVGLQHGWDYFDYPNAMVRMRGAVDCSVISCHFRKAGGGGLRLDLTASGIRVENNLFEHLGGTGILLAGYGVGTKDVNRDNVIRNNHIHRIGELKRDAIAIWAYQSGHNLIENNLIHDVPYTAISVSTRSSPLVPGGEGSAFKRLHEIEADSGVQGTYEVWNRLEKYWHNRKNKIIRNEIFAVMQYMADGNGIYVSGAGRGNEVRSNYIHHSPSPGLHAAIRCDDVQHETLIADNVIYKTYGHGSAINSKGRNDILNNFVIEPGLSAYHTGIFEFASYLPGGILFRHNVTVVDNPALMPVSLGRTRPAAGSIRITFDDIQSEENLYRCFSDPEWAERYLSGARREGGERGSLPDAPAMEVTEDKRLLVADTELLDVLGIRLLDPRQAGLRLDAFPERLRGESRSIRKAALDAAVQEVAMIDERAKEPFSFSDSFEHYAGVGLPAYYEFATGGDADVEVAEALGAYDGSHMLRFTDGPEAGAKWMPALFVRTPSPVDGIRKLALKFRIVSGQPEFRIEHRYGAGSGFQTLSWFKVDSSGVFINSRRIDDMPVVGEWMRLEMTVDHGRQVARADWGVAESDQRMTIEESFVDQGAAFTGIIALYGPGVSVGEWQVDEIEYSAVSSPSPDD